MCILFGFFSDKCDKENGFWSGNVLISQTTDNHIKCWMFSHVGHPHPGSKVLLITVLENSLFYRKSGWL